MYRSGSSPHPGPYIEEPNSGDILTKTKSILNDQNNQNDDQNNQNNQNNQNDPTRNNPSNSQHSTLNTDQPTIKNTTLSNSNHNVSVNEDINDKNTKNNEINNSDFFSKKVNNIHNNNNNNDQNDEKNSKNFPKSSLTIQISTTPPFNSIPYQKNTSHNNTNNDNNDNKTNIDKNNNNNTNINNTTTSLEEDNDELLDRVNLMNLHHFPNNFPKSAKNLIGFPHKLQNQSQMNNINNEHNYEPMYKHDYNHFTGFNKNNQQRRMSYSDAVNNHTNNTNNKLGNHVHSTTPLNTTSGQFSAIKITTQKNFIPEHDDDDDNDDDDIIDANIIQQNSPKNTQNIPNTNNNPNNPPVPPVTITSETNPTSQQQSIANTPHSNKPHALSTTSEGLSGTTNGTDTGQTFYPLSQTPSQTESSTSSYHSHLLLQHHNTANYGSQKSGYGNYISSYYNSQHLNLNLHHNNNQNNFENNFGSNFVSNFVANFQNSSHFSTANNNVAQITQPTTRNIQINHDSDSDTDYEPHIFNSIAQYPIGSHFGQNFSPNNQNTTSQQKKPKNSNIISNQNETTTTTTTTTTIIITTPTHNTRKSTQKPLKTLDFPDSNTLDGIYNQNNPDLLPEDTNFDESINDQNKINNNKKIMKKLMKKLIKMVEMKRTIHPVLVLQIPILIIKSFYNLLHIQKDTLIVLHRLHLVIEIVFMLIKFLILNIMTKIIILTLILITVISPPSIYKPRNHQILPESLIIIIQSILISFHQLYQI